jgi:hypothetical protein
MRKTAAKPPLITVRIRFQPTTPSQPSTQPTAVDPRPERQLSDIEIVQELKRLRHSSQLERNARRAPSINDLAVRTGITRAWLYEIMRTGRVGRRSRQPLSKALQNLSM